MAETKKFCIHSDGLGYCDVLSDDTVRQYCVEGPCPHEKIVEYAPVVRCGECKHFRNLTCKIRKGSWGEQLKVGFTDFCSDGERKGSDER